ncbi:MAG: stage II sporulation protein M [Chloroflexota bacterium]|nr:stage II sporulation protein M [Chloroflexota bacterium]MDE3193943.1 stage II sporulation protein M [Chloroflexota bacterium]
MRAVQSVDRFIEDRRPRWARLAQLVEKAADRASRLEASEIVELGELYRAATSDLAIARRDHPRDAVTERLNDLVAAAHALVYSEAPTSGGRLRRFVGHDLPETVRASAPFILVAAAALFLPALVTYAIGVASPDVAASALSDQTKQELAQRRPGSEIPLDLRPIAGPLIVVNNVRVAVVAFAGGLTAGVLTVVVLLLNGAELGAAFAVLHGGEGEPALLTFVLAHGFLELSAIVLSAGAGLRLAWAILHPGDLSRADALRLAGAQAIRIVVLTVVVLGVAGTIEAFVSPTQLPVWGKLVVGLTTGSALWTYVLLVGRRGTSAR